MLHFRSQYTIHTCDIFSLVKFISTTSLKSLELYRCNTRFCFIHDLRCEGIFNVYNQPTKYRYPVNVDSYSLHHTFSNFFFSLIRLFITEITIFNGSKATNDSSCLNYHWCFMYYFSYQMKIFMIFNTKHFKTQKLLIKILKH